MKWLRKIVNVYAVSFLLANTVIFVHTFITAYMNDGSILVHVNRFNEGPPELFMIIAGCFALIYLVWRYGRQIFDLLLEDVEQYTDKYNKERKV